MDLRLKKQFRGETNLDVFVWDENNNVAFTEAYVNWLEKQCTIADVVKPLPSKEDAVAEGYRIAKDAGYNYRRVLKEPDHDIYYSGWMDCHDWMTK